MKKIILHIGTHKTGTTSIQQFLFRNSVELNLNGYCYPKKGIDYFAHQNIAYYLNGDSRYNPELGDLKAAFDEFSTSSCSICILSSENFEFLSAESISMIQDYCIDFGFGLGVRLYLREQSDFLRSEYTQRVKHGFCTLNFQEFIDVEISNARYDYSKFYDKWRAVDDFSIRFFDKQVIKENNVVVDFLDFTGLLGFWDEMSPSKNSNFSPPDIIVEAIRRLALYYVDDLLMDSYDFSNKISSKILSQDWSSFEFESNVSLFGAGQIEYVRDFFKDKNFDFINKFNSNINGMIPDSFLSDIKRSTYEDVNLDLSLRDFIRIIGPFLKHEENFSYRSQI